MDNENIKTLEDNNLIQVYNRLPVTPERGKGAKIISKEGEEYLDMVAGIAVASLGHSHPNVVDAINRQTKKIMHCSNLYHIESQAKLANKLSDVSCLDKAFFCNSGTEAVESAIKLARKTTGKKKIIAAENSFHGRTLGALSATWKKRYRKPFKPLVPGFEFIKYNDANKLREAVDEETAAVILEPIQGEGGLNVPRKEFMKQAREITRKNSSLLILDEVQTGIGRTGKMFGYKHYDIEPDIISLAKALGNGFPIGAMLAKKETANKFEPGDHASTFGGNPMACSAGLATIKTIEDQNLLKRTKELGNYFKNQLEKLKERKEWIKEVRGKGLMIGVQIEDEANKVVKEAIDQNILINKLGKNVLRFVPPLVIQKDSIKKVVSFLDER
ncbi:acetylornithine transaminase [archaeon SCG-AAA382B04]|nr:acetylornithine transaminase [archaeon SCG-AAA382B04]